MPQARRAKGGEVALVIGGGTGLGRAVALTLGAQGIPVVVEGLNERDVARVVGEITCGGGAARHVAGDVAQPAYLEAAIARAIETFGGLRYVILTSFDAVLCHRVAHAIKSPFEQSAGGRMVLMGALDLSQGRGQTTELAGEMAVELESVGATANAVLWQDRGGEDVERLMELVIFLCSEAADGVSGEGILVRGRGRTDA